MFTSVLIGRGRRTGCNQPADQHHGARWGIAQAARGAAAAGAALITATAGAAAVLAVAAPAGASTGSAQISPEQAGYTATGAKFRRISASVYLPQPTQYAGEVASLAYSVQLWSADRVLTVGVRASTSGGGYTPYATIYDRSTHQVIASNPNASWCTTPSLCGSTIGSFPAGDTISLYIDYDHQIGVLDFGVRSGVSPSFQAYVNPFGSESFTQARVGTEFGDSPWDASYPHTPPADYVKAADFSDVLLTTYKHHVSTLRSGWVHHKLLADTGQQTASDLVAIPHNLTNGGASFQVWLVPQSAQRSSQPAAP
jgi:hypothetical protein